MILDSQICENIVIGGSTEAILYAYKHKYPLIMPYVEPLFPFENINIEIANLKNPLEEELRCKLLFLMGLDSLLPIPFSVSGVKIKNQVIMIAIKDKGTVVYKFDKLHIFDDRNVRGLPKVVDARKRKRTVIDWFVVKTGMEHEHEEYREKGLRLIFYPTERFAGRTTLKDVIAITSLQKKQLNDFDYSSSMVRLQVEEIMVNMGVAPKIEIEFAERQVIGQDRYIYEEDERFIFLEDMKIEEIAKLEEKESYCSQLGI